MDAVKGAAQGITRVRTDQTARATLGEVSAKKPSPGARSTEAAIVGMSRGRGSSPVSTRSRSRPNPAVLDGTPVTTHNLPPWLRERGLRNLERSLRTSEVASSRRDRAHGPAGRSRDRRARPRGRDPARVARCRSCAARRTDPRRDDHRRCAAGRRGRGAVDAMLLRRLDFVVQTRWTIDGEPVAACEFPTPRASARCH
jgi:hypothetical protein